MGTKLTAVELEEDFTFADEVHVPPCGQVYPDGVALKLQRFRGDSGFVACYTGPVEGKGDATVAIIIASMQDPSGNDMPLHFEVLTAYPHDRTHFDIAGYDIVALMDFPDGKLPAGINQTSFVSSDRNTDIADLVAKKVVDVAHAQGSAIQCELSNQDRRMSDLVDTKIALAQSAQTAMEKISGNEGIWHVDGMLTEGKGCGWLEFGTDSIETSRPERAVYAMTITDEGESTPNGKNWRVEPDDAPPTDLTGMVRFFGDKLRISVDFDEIGQARADLRSLYGVMHGLEESQVLGHHVELSKTRNQRESDISR